MTEKRAISAGVEKSWKQREKKPGRGIKQAKIEKLEQYKKSLIYEYVTGKREVS